MTYETGLNALKCAVVNGIIRRLNSLNKCYIVGS